MKRLEIFRNSILSEGLGFRVQPVELGVLVGFTDALPACSELYRVSRIQGLSLQVFGQNSLGKNSPLLDK